MVQKTKTRLRRELELIILPDISNVVDAAERGDRPCPPVQRNAPVRGSRFFARARRRAARGGRTLGAGARLVPGDKAPHCSGEVVTRQSNFFAPCGLSQRDRVFPGVGPRGVGCLPAPQRARPMVSFPNAKPMSTPRPVPWSTSETSPFVSACASADLPAPAWASDWTYEPNSSPRARAPVNLPVPPMISDFPKVMPPPVALIVTRAFWPLLHLIVPSPLAVL